MSAAATAAGYLYASGRLRGRNLREQEAQQEPAAKSKQPGRPRVAVYAPAAERQEAPREPAAVGGAARPKSAPKIQYRTRRWKPE
jgi:hypothetical protein